MFFINVLLVTRSIKFFFYRLIVASEALFSLINGDDMYMTYEEMGKKSYATWIFSQVCDNFLIEYQRLY